MKTLQNLFLNIGSNNFLLIAMALVFFGFGIAKFATYEQLAVADLVARHPLLSVGTSLLGARGFAVLLGVVELCTSILLLFAVRSPVFGLWGGALGVLTFVTTLTIFPFVQFFEPAAGKLFLSSTGQFLMKDVGLLAACVAIARNAAVLLANSDHQGHG